MDEQPIDRALRWAHERGWDQSDLAQRLGVDRANITNWKARRLPPERFKEVAELFGKTIDELTGGRPPLPPDSELSLQLGDFTIPQYDTGGAMGHGIELHEQPGVIRQWRVTDEWLRRNVTRYTHRNNLAIVTGFGPSMQPLFNPGDPLLVDKGIIRADVDGIYFFRIGDQGFVKQLQRLPSASGMVLRAKSYNEMYDPFDITDGMDFQVFARVVKVWRGEEF